MAVEDINYMNNIDSKLVGIAKGVGVEFRNNSDLRQSQSFREQMKERQRKNKLKKLEDKE